MEKEGANTQKISRDQLIGLGLLGWMSRGNGRGRG